MRLEAPSPTLHTGGVGVMVAEMWDGTARLFGPSHVTEQSRSAHPEEGEA